MWSKLLSVGAAAVVTILVVGGIAAAQQAGRSASSIVGVWRVVEITTTGENARTYSAQPGQRIFTQRHYSVIAVTADKPRPELPPIDKATDKGLLDAWRAFGANAGTYEVKGNEIRFQALVAKNPNVMRPGNVLVETFKLDGDTLWLTAKSNQDGPVKNPNTLKLTRVE